MNAMGLLKGASIALFTILLVLVMLDVSWPAGDMDRLSNEDVAESLFGTSDATGYALVVLMVGILLLVALLGGVFLAKEEKE